MLKKFLIGTFVAFALLVSTTALAAYDFGPTTLKVGSSGDYVKTLQTFVGASPVDGAFGPMTKAKVMAWQASNGLTADGMFGNLSKAKANDAGSNFPAGCVAAAGFSSVTGLPCASVVANTFAPAGCVSASGFSPVTGGACYAVSAGNLPAGCTVGAMFSSTTGMSCTGGTTPGMVTGTEGSLSFEYNATPAVGVSIKKGETNQEAVAFKMKATNGDVKISRLWVDMQGVRPWLTASKATLVDGSTVLGTMDLSASTVTELTSSTWQLQFNNLSVVVPSGVTKILTVKLDRPTLTSSDADWTILASTSIRTVDGSGFSDTKSSIGTRSVVMDDGVALAGKLTATLNSNSPLDQSVSGLSSTVNVTSNIKLMDFDLKATDGAVNVTDVTGTIATTGCTVAKCISSVELRDGATVLATETVTDATGAFGFTDLDLNVAQDATKTLSIFANVNSVSTNYVTAGDSIKATVATVLGTSGANYATANAPTGVSGHKQYLYKYAPALTLGAVSALQADESTSTTVQKGANYSIAFTVTAPSGSDIYVNTVGMVVTKSVFATGATIAPNTTVSGTESKGTGTSSTYDRVAAGTSRTFTVTAYVAHGGTLAGFTNVNIASIPWTATDNTAASAQTWGLADFKTASVYVSL